MPATLPSSFPLLVEQGLSKTRNKPQSYSYRPGKGRPGSIIRAEMSAAEEKGITVFCFSPRSGRLAEARNTLKKYSASSHSVIAVTSPRVFNQPDFRSLLADHHIEVLVEEPERFEVRQLLPWLQRLTSVAGISRKDSKAPKGEVNMSLRDAASGRLDARKVHKLFGLSMTEIATKICGVSKQALCQRPTSAGIQPKLRPLEEIAQALAWCGNEEARFRVWLRRPQEDFPEINGEPTSVLDLLLSGHASIAAAKVRNLLSGHPS